MRQLLLGSFTAIVLLGIAACSDDGTSSPPAATPEAGALPDREAPPADAGPRDATTQADADATATCAIADDATVTGTLQISVDDNFKLYVNGALVKEFTGTWNNVQTETVTLNRHPAKKNVIAVEGINTAKIGGLDRMIVADLAFTAGAAEAHVLTDATWLRGSGGLEAGWFESAFAETGWVAATEEGTNGDAPYGAILGASTAKYLWSYDSALVDVGTKPDVETVYFRKTFYIDLSGAPSATPIACP